MDLLKMLTEFVSEEGDAVSTTEMTDQEKALLNAQEGFITEAARRARNLGDEKFDLIAKRLGFASAKAMHEAGFSLSINTENGTVDLKKKTGKKSGPKKTEVGSMNLPSIVTVRREGQKARADRIRKVVEELTNEEQKDRDAMWDDVARAFGYQDNLDAIARGACFKVDFEKNTMTHFKSEAATAAAASS